MKIINIIRRIGMICAKCGALVSESNPICWNCKHKLLAEDIKKCNTVKGNYSSNKINE